MFVGGAGIGDIWRTNKCATLVEASLSLELRYQGRWWLALVPRAQRLFALGDCGH
jgi:hypothetical protein